MKCLSRLSILITTIFMVIFASALHAQHIAITMDNPNSDPSPLLSPEQRDQKILSALNKQHVKIVLFVQGSQVDNQQGMRLLQRWNNAGHILGNHTYSHMSLNQISEKQYVEDTLKNEKILQKYSGFKKIFRFPFLKEGDTIAKRDTFRQFLKDHQYEIGSVTIDASDWYISERLEEKLTQNPKTDVTPYKKYYLAHIWDRAQYYDNLAVAVLGKSPNHTLLIHHNLLNALFLDDLIQMFKDKGWHVINADEAFNDRVFNITPNTLPAGESLIWALAKQTGRYEDKLRYPGESEIYEKESMDKLGL